MLARQLGVLHVEKPGRCQLMMRYFFAFLLLIHGLIHVLGFAKAFRYADISQLTQAISRPAGLLWLLCTALLVVAVVLFLLRSDRWWMVAAPAVLLSQVLIFTSWQDAKFGTIPNLTVLVAIVLAYGSWRFQVMTDREFGTFLPAVPVISPPVVTAAMLAGLPPSVQKWLERSNVIGKPVTYTVHLQQKGEMRSKPDGKWLPLVAEQYFTTQEPGFIWTTEIQAAHMLYIVGRDKYQNGHGHILIKLMALYAVADAKGPDIDQGTMLRYLAETVWFPSAVLNDYIQWESIDATTAVATMNYGGISASGIFRFNTEGDVLSFEAKRYYDRKTGATLEDWLIENKAWKALNGIRIPYQSEVTWKLKNGDYTWLKLEIESIDYN